MQTYVDIPFSGLVFFFFFWFEIHKVLIHGSIESKDIPVTTTWRPFPV